MRPTIRLGVLILAASLLAIAAPADGGVYPDDTQSSRTPTTRKVRAVITKADPRIDRATRRLADDLRTVKRAGLANKTLPPTTASHIRAIVEELQQVDRRISAVPVKTPAERTAKKLVATTMRDYINGANAAQVVASGASDARKQRAASKGHKALVRAAKSARLANHYLGCTLRKCGGLFGSEARSTAIRRAPRHWNAYLPKATSATSATSTSTSCENCDAKRKKEDEYYVWFIHERCLGDLPIGAGPVPDMGPGIDSVFCLVIEQKRHQDAIENIDNNCHEPLQYSFTELGPITATMADGSVGLYWFKGRISAPGSVYGRPWLMARRSHWTYPPSYQQPPMDSPYEPFTMVLQRGVPTQIYWGGSLDADLLIVESPDGDPNGMQMAVQGSTWSTGADEVPITCVSY